MSIGMFSVLAWGAPLPVYYSSDAEHDRLANDLFRRHLRIDVSDTSLRKYPQDHVPTYLTCTYQREYEALSTLWYDASSANFPLENRLDMFMWDLGTTPVDRFGYYFSCFDNSANPLTTPQVDFGMGWPFPDYIAGFGGLAAGWEWNGNGAEGWTFENVDSTTVANGYLEIKSTQANPRLLSPPISVNWSQVPFIMMDVNYLQVDANATAAERVFTVHWATSEQPTFSEDRVVRSDTWPAVPVAQLQSGFAKRLWLPMYLHPQWRDKTIVRLRIEPLKTSVPRSMNLRLSSLRLDYDTRHAVNNPIFIRACAEKFCWDGNQTWFKDALPRMRRATEFMLTHMKGRELGLIDQNYFVGHDGLAWRTPSQCRVGQGIPTNWFDALPMGPYDLESCVMFLESLRAMASIEAWVEAHPEVDSPKPSVADPSGVGTIAYHETAATLRGLVERSRQAIHQKFWVNATGRYAGWRDADDTLKDYGYTHLNFEALIAGVADDASAQQVLRWIRGQRVVSGDTSVCDDIYHYKFAARMSTRRNPLDWVWTYGVWAPPGTDACVHTDGMRHRTLAVTLAWGDWVMDGGAVLFTTYYDVKARLLYGDVEGAWQVWRRMLDHHAAVLAFGAKGPRFYQDYYKAEPSRGILQGDGQMGGVGLDCELIENVITPMAWARVWVGIDSPEPDVLSISPTLPPALTRMGVRNVVYRGNRLDILVTKDTIDLSGSNITAPQAGRLRLCFRDTGLSNPRMWLDGQLLDAPPIRTPQGFMIETAIAAGRFEMKGESSTVSHVKYL